MRKLFTSVMAALCMAAPLSTLSAQQTQLTEAQKEAFKKEVLPVVFEQIKEQAGIDILGWANPQIKANSISGIPGLESSNLLRAASATQNISVKPDSIFVNIDAIAGGVLPIQLGNAKVTFEGYDTKSISVGDLSFSIDLPAVINVTVPALNMSVATINFETEVGQMYGLPFSMDVNMTSDLLSLSNADIVNASLALNGTNLEANVDIESGLQQLLTNIEGLGSMFGGFNIPENVVSALNVDYLVRVEAAGLLGSVASGATTIQVPAHLYAVATNTNIPMGDAVLTLNLQNQLMPAEKIDVTGYANGVANAWSLFEISATKTENSSYSLLKLDVDKSIHSSAEKADTTLVETTTISMTDYTPSISTDPQAAAKSVVSRAIAELSNEGEATYYKMDISKTIYAADKSSETVEVATISVSPTTEGADINIDLKNDTTYTVRAVIEDKTVAASVILTDANSEETTFGTAYFAYNLSQGTPDATEEISAAAIRIIPTDNGVRVLNAERADYQIVSMTGSTVARGVVSGDETISTANLPKGIYVIAVDQNGDREVVKFVR